MPPLYPLALFPMISLMFALVWKFALPLILIIAVVDVLTQSQPQRIRRLYRSGLSQRSIASRLGVSRYQVRMALG
jgi:DNA invertase Pin-like site-specific DNA recombinase